MSNTSRRSASLSLLVLACFPAWASATDFFVHNAAEITAAQASAKPGDTITMADGTWANQSITFSAAGNAANPITLRAQTPGRVVLTGTSKLSITGDYLVADGLYFTAGTLTSGNIVSFSSSSSFSRLTNSAIVDYDALVDSGYHWIHVDGQQNRVDHNFIKGHKNDGVTLELSPASNSYHQIDHNQFVDRPAGNGNGFETIRIGVSGIQTRTAHTIVESNLFERVDGELEIISNKTSENVIRNNTIRASAGTITLRHGQGSVVSGNYILGENKSGTGGIRVIGPNQTVVNNYMADLDTNALSITTGYSDWNVATTATGYEPVYNTLIAHNTVVNVSDQIVTRDAGYSSSASSTRNVRPHDLTIADNIFYKSTETMIQGTEGANWTWAGNIAFSAPSIGKSGAGILNVDPKLVKDAQGIYRPAAGSPAINGAVTAGLLNSPLANDIDGQARTLPNDIGADETNGVGAATNGPLSASDVGPAWLKRRTMPDGTYPVPVIVIEAEDFTANRDPNGDGDRWNVLTSPFTSGGKYLKAPAGTRTDVPSQTQDAVVEYDVAFNDPGTYHLYILTRGPDTGSDSLYSPATLGADPTVVEDLPDNNQWVWTDIATYTITSAQVNVPITLKLGRREGNLEIDKLIFSPTALSLSVPEPVSVSVVLATPLLLRRRRYLPTTFGR